KIVALIIILLLLSTSYSEIRAVVAYKTVIARVRKSLLQSIRTVRPVIPSNTIFFFKCKEICHKNELFSLSSAWVLPFSSGPGWNLLVLYSQKQAVVWGKFLTDNFLLDLNSQGYKQINNDSFGYFIDKKILKQTLMDHHLRS